MRKDDGTRGLQGPCSLSGPGPAGLGQKILAGPGPGSPVLLGRSLANIQESWAPGARLTSRAWASWVRLENPGWPRPWNSWASEQEPCKYTKVVGSRVQAHFQGLGQLGWARKSSLAQALELLGFWAGALQTYKNRGLQRPGSLPGPGPAGLG